MQANRNEIFYAKSSNKTFYVRFNVCNVFIITTVICIYVDDDCNYVMDIIGNMRYNQHRHVNKLDIFDIFKAPTSKSNSKAKISKIDNRKQQAQQWTVDISIGCSKFDVRHSIKTGITSSYIPALEHYLLELEVENYYNHSTKQKVARL